MSTSVNSRHGHQCSPTPVDDKQENANYKQRKENIDLLSPDHEGGKLAVDPLDISAIVILEIVKLERAGRATLENI